MGFQTDVLALEPGSIVKVEHPQSSTGRATYAHFFVVLDVPPNPKAGDLILLMGISSTIIAASFDPAKHVAMKWLNRRGGDPETGFDRPSYACANFPCVLEVVVGDDAPLVVIAEHRGKFIRKEKLQTVVAVRNAWALRKLSS